MELNIEKKIQTFWLVLFRLIVFLSVNLVTMNFVLELILVESYSFI